MDFPWLIAQLIYQRHEWLDGSGCPNALKDAEIVLGARIISGANDMTATWLMRAHESGVENYQRAIWASA